MQDSTTANTDTFDRLLDAMPAIAEAVNKFESKKNQQRALDALVRTLGGGEPSSERPMDREQLHVVPEPERDGPTTEKPDEGPVEQRSEPAAAASKKVRKASGKKNFSVPKGLNFAPEGQTPLDQFVAEKSPSSMNEKNLVACWYLSNAMGLKVDTEHVLAVFQAAKWEPAAQPDVSLRKTASQTGWIDTSNGKDIKVVWSGEHHIANKMPPGKRKSA